MYIVWISIMLSFQSVWSYTGHRQKLKYQAVKNIANEIMGVLHESSKRHDDFASYTLKKYNMKNKTQAQIELENRLRQYLFNIGKNSTEDEDLKKKRRCDRSVLNPEGPKYDRRGKVDKKEYFPIDGKDFTETKKPNKMHPKCCNCCAKSVLGCE